MSAPTASDPGARLSLGIGESLLVSEIFGPTFQGEGPSIGRRCAFLRLGACNLRCRWCDTPYTWDWTGRNGQAFDPRTELRRIDVASVWDSLRAMDVNCLVVSGGEPMLQQRQLFPLLQSAWRADWWIEVETAGTVLPETQLLELVSRFNVSPKLANSGNRRSERYQPAVLEALQMTGMAAWKFVVQTRRDLDEIAVLARRHSLAPIYVMPEGTQAEVVIDRARALADDVLARGWNLTPRLHILLFGDRRGT